MTIDFDFTRLCRLLNNETFSDFRESLHALYTFSSVCVSDEVDTFENQALTLMLLGEVMLIVLDTSVGLTVVEEVEFGVVESFWKSLNQSFNLNLIRVFRASLIFDVKEL